MLKIYLNLAYIQKGLQGQLSHLVVKIWQNLGTIIFTIWCVLSTYRKYTLNTFCTLTIFKLNI